MTKTPFEAIYTAATDACPQLAAKNTHVIHEWIATGYDATLDVLPAIKEATKRGGQTIRSFSYFTGFIRTMNERRVKTEAKPQEITQAEKDAARAKNIQWHLDKGLASTKIGPRDYEWLRRYKEANGLGA